MKSRSQLMSPRVAALVLLLGFTGFYTFVLGSPRANLPRQDPEASGVNGINGVKGEGNSKDAADAIGKSQTLAHCLGFGAALLALAKSFAKAVPLRGKRGQAVRSTPSSGFGGLWRSGPLSSGGSSFLGSSMAGSVTVAAPTAPKRGALSSMTMMFERFNEKAIKSVMLAQEESRRLNHNFVDVEMLLVGVIAENSSIAAKVMRKMGVQLKDVKRIIQEQLGQGEGPVKVEIPFTPEAKQILENCVAEAQSLNSNAIDTAHILLALCKDPSGKIQKCLEKLNVDAKKTPEEIIKELQDKDEKVAATQQAKGGPGGKNATLEEFGRDLTKAAAEGMMDPLVGREAEIERTIQILARRQKNNPVLIGEPGVGKTAIGNQEGAGKSKAKGQKAVQKAEDDREVQRKATSMLLEKLQLNRPRKAVMDDVPEGTSEKTSRESTGNNAGNSNPMAEEDAEEDVEMSTAAAAQLGRQDHLERHHLPGILLPDGVFETTLRPYQAQAVYWMWQRENPTSTLPSHFKRSGLHDSSTAATCSTRAAPSSPKTSERQLHPMWDEYELPEVTGPLPSSSGRESARFLYYHRTTGALSLDFPDAALAHCRGGILADDMGLGKTVMCLALMALDLGDLPTARSAAPELRALEEAEPFKSKGLFPGQQGQDDGVGGVLVVAPLSLIRQWQSEAQKHFSSSSCPSLYEFHGSARKISTEELRNYGIVMTTYNTLASQNDDSPLFQLYWRRIILDEAHAIKNRCSRQAQAAFQLRGFCRWCVTGTPLQNSVEELFSAIRFLRVEPWCAWPTWRQSVSIPLDKGRQGDSEAMAEALDTARRIVTPLIIRRTKSTVDPNTGEPLLRLPAKHVHVHRLQLSLAERDFYETLWTKAKTQFDTFVAAGEVLSKYTHILQLILKLRQALCHPFMVFARESTKDTDLQELEKRYLLDAGGDQVSEAFANQLWEEIKNGQLSDCAICCDAPQDPTMTPCGHIFCRECCFQIIQKFKGECPICRRTGISKKNLTVLPGASRFPAQLMAKASGGSGNSAEASHYSTKMKELMKLLKTDMAEGHRAVVYSQFTSFMDLIGSALDAEGIGQKRFDGSLSLDQRAACVAWLAEETPGRSGARVLLVSLKAGGTGLNLVAASRLYLMDLWWNPAVEEQAIQRVHRIGQKQEVHIYKFVVEDSIDIDLLELHGAKERLLEDALRGGRHSETAGKLTMDDLKRLFNPCRSSLRNLKNSGAELKADLEPRAGATDVVIPDAPSEVASAAPGDDVAVESRIDDRELRGPVQVQNEQIQEQPLVACWDAAGDLLEESSHRSVETAVQDSWTAEMPQDVVMAVAGDEATATFSPGDNFDCPKTQEQPPVAAWEAAGDLLEGASRDFGFGEDDISDSELLAACHAAEAYLVQSMEGERELGSF